MLRGAILFLTCLLLSLPATAQKRIALVIGNSAYQHTPTLTNPRNDATDMAAALKKLGFQVIEGFDLDKASFDRKVRDFADALSGANVAVFFFAGHGLQVAGANYLVPVDAKLSSASALDWEMVRLDLVQRTMERETETNVIFLDACRDNPLARNLARAMGTRSADVGRGLAAAEAGAGTLISFSTQPGNVALDGVGRNSPFAGALAKRIASSSDDLSAMLIDVRNDVRKETQNRQVPWEHSALTGRFYFNAPKDGKSVAGGSHTPNQLSEAAQTWAAIKDTQDVRTLEAFRRQYGSVNFLFDRLAEARLDELKKQLVAALPPSSATEARPTATGSLIAGYEVERLSSITGPIVAASNLTIDASKPDPAIASCANHCNARRACVAFDISVVYGRCTLYGEVEKKGSLGGFISGVKIVSPAPTPARCEGVEATVGNERRCLKPKDTFKDCDTCPEMVVIPAGEFMMGSNDGSSDEKPVHKATVAMPFAVGKFELTFTEWDECVTADGCKHKSGAGWARGRQPAINVSWDDATKQYLPWLSRKTGVTYRLLTDVEWEYAARGVTTASAAHTTYAWGNDIGKNRANCNGCGSQWDNKQPAPVGSFAANAFGLHDMHGNVWEWVQDCYKNSLATPCHRIVRGGSWDDRPENLRSAISLRNAPEYISSRFGFRVARTLDP